MNYPSINLDRMDGTDERSEYEELIKENIGFDYLIRNYHYDRDRLQEIVDIILDVVCSCAETIRINGEDIPVAVIKSRYLKLNDSHIEYVIDSMAKNSSDIRNIRAYLLTALYNAPVIFTFERIKTLMSVSCTVTALHLSSSSCANVRKRRTRIKSFALKGRWSNGTSIAEKAKSPYPSS